MIKAAEICDEQALQLKHCSDVSPDKVAGAAKCARLLFAKSMMMATERGVPIDLRVLERYQELANANGIAAFSRDGGKYVVVLNFRGMSWDRYNVGVRGRYQELANEATERKQP